MPLKTVSQQVTNDGAVANQSAQKEERFPCQWQGCNRTFKSKTASERHGLTFHQAPFNKDVEAVIMAKVEENGPPWFCLCPKATEKESKALVRDHLMRLGSEGHVKTHREIAWNLNPNINVSASAAVMNQPGPTASSQAQQTGFINDNGVDDDDAEGEPDEDGL